MPPRIVAMACRSDTVAATSRHILRRNSPRSIRLGDACSAKIGAVIRRSEMLRAFDGFAPLKLRAGSDPCTAIWSQALFQTGGSARAAGKAMSADAKAMGPAISVRTFLQALQLLQGQAGRTASALHGTADRAPAARCASVQEQAYVPPSCAIKPSGPGQAPLPEDRTASFARHTEPCDNNRQRAQRHGDRHEKQNVAIIARAQPGFGDWGLHGSRSTSPQC